MEDLAERRHEAMVASVAQCISARRGVHAAEGYSPTLHGVVHARRVVNARAGAPPPPVVVRSRRGDGGRRLRRVARRLARAVARRRALLVLYAVARGHVHIRRPFGMFRMGSEPKARGWEEAEEGDGGQEDRAERAKPAAEEREARRFLGRGTRLLWRRWASWPEYDTFTYNGGRGGASR